MPSRQALKKLRDTCQSRFLELFYFPLPPGVLSFWDNAAGQLYGIRSIPSNVLVGPDGVIVAKNLRGEKLFSKQEELLGPASAGE